MLWIAGCKRSMSDIGIQTDYGRYYALVCFIVCVLYVLLFVSPLYGQRHIHCSASNDSHTLRIIGDTKQLFAE